MEPYQSLQYWLVIPISGYLYRAGGGDIWPFKKGHKWLRRYVLPLIGALLTGFWFEMVILSAILHFNLDEVEERDWDDVACYGMAQTACFIAMSGVWAWVLGLWWLLGTYWSNNGENEYRLDWKYVEIVQGFLIGALFIERTFYYANLLRF